MLKLNLPISHARWLVPKMVKNGDNSLFTIHNRFCYPFGIHALKTDQNSENKNYNHFRPISGQASAL
jgi:hypothetical protein